MKLRQWMLREARGYIITHKAIFMKAIIAFARILPEFTREDCDRPNTAILLDIRDKFFKYDTIESRRPLYEAAWKILIAEYEHDGDETFRLDWLVEEIANSEWQPRPMGHPVTCWQEPDPYGGGFLIKDETLGKRVNIIRMKNMGLLQEDER